MSGSIRTVRRRYPTDLHRPCAVEWHVYSIDQLGRPTRPSTLPKRGPTHVLETTELRRGHSERFRDRGTVEIDDILDYVQHLVHQIRIYE
jgi:hypothetical protein